MPRSIGTRMPGSEEIALRAISWWIPQPISEMKKASVLRKGLGNKGCSKCADNAAGLGSKTLNWMCICAICDRYRKIEPLAIGLHKSLASLIERLLQQIGGVSKWSMIWISEWLTLGGLHL